jgi:hypothetical protein
VLRSLVLLLVMAAVYLTLRWFLRQSRGIKVGAGLSAIGLGMVLLAASGRIPWVFGLVGGLLPLLVIVQSARRQRDDDRRYEQESTGGQSVVETRFLRMTLDHDTGEMAGQVLAGRFAGVAFDALSQEQLLELLDDLASEDDESAALLRAYLDRTYGSDWQEAPREDRNPEGMFGEMTRSDAYAILGLEEGASREQVIAAHGRLIQRLHPDRGGSTFLAAKINQARDLLLGA